MRVALDVCPCCRPSIGFGNDGSVYVSWRAVLDNNVRDVMIAASRDEGATWGAPVRVAEDNWVINGCPHSGASIGAIGKRLFIAWHAVREKQAGLSLAYSDDGGKTFSRRIPLAEGVLDANHPYMNKVGDNLGIVFQGRPSGKQEGWAPLAVYYREVEPDGKLTPLQMMKPVAGSASYPVFTFEDPERLFVAWTEPNKDGKAVALARGRRSAVPIAATTAGVSNAAR